MKNLTLALVVALSLAFGFSSAKASEIRKSETNITCETGENYIHIRVY